MGRDSHQVYFRVDVSSKRLGIRTHVVSTGQHGLGHFSIQAAQADLESRAKKATVVALPKVHFRVDHGVYRKFHRHFGGHLLYRAQKAA